MQLATSSGRYSIYWIVLAIFIGFYKILTANN